MRRAQLSIRKLMAIVLVAGLGLAALAQPNKGWSIVAPAFLLTMVMTSILGIGFRRGPRRAFWVGFAVFGWTFLAPIFIWKDEFGGSPISGDRFIFVLFINFIDIFAVFGVRHERSLADIWSSLREIDDASSMVVAFSLAGLVFASVGGLIARSFSRNDPPVG